MNTSLYNLKSSMAHIHSISGRISSCFRRIFSMSMPEYCDFRSSGLVENMWVIYVSIDDLRVSIVVHLLDVRQPVDERSQNRHTSSDKVELPHPSMRILAFLFGMSSRIRSAMSAYFLNQSKVLSSDSLRRLYVSLVS